MLPATILESNAMTRLRNHPEHLEDTLSIERLESIRYRAANVAATYAEMDGPVAQELTGNLRTLAASAASLINIMERREPLIKERLKRRKT
jgi:hypothetical protein